MLSGVKPQHVVSYKKLPPLPSPPKKKYTGHQLGKSFHTSFFIYVLAACEVFTKHVCPHCGRCFLWPTDRKRVTEL